MKIIKIIVLLVFVGSMNVDAAVSDSLSVRIDSSTIRQRTFSENLSDKYAGEDFDYTSVEGEAQNFIARAINWFFNKLGEIFGFKLSPEMYQVVELIVYVLLGILVLYLVVRFMLGSSASSVFSRKAAVIHPLNITEEHIENVDLDKFIRDALEQQNYRLVIRFMYLRVLKQLSLRHFIEWHFDKTNHDYYREIKHDTLKEDFKKVSYLYDYIWYGEFPLDEAGYQSAKKDFDRLTKVMNHAG